MLDTAVKSISTIQYGFLLVVWPSRHFLIRIYIRIPGSKKKILVQESLNTNGNE